MFLLRSKRVDSFQNTESNFIRERKLKKMYSMMVSIILEIQIFLNGWREERDQAIKNDLERFPSEYNYKINQTNRKYIVRAHFFSRGRGEKTWKESAGE